MFTVFPSYYEGWGLPIGESLWFKKFVVCSSSSSMPEVGGTMVDYVDPHCIISMKTKIKNAILDEEYLKRRTEEIQPAMLRSWDRVATDLMDAAMAPLQAADSTGRSYSPALQTPASAPL
jgi:hypothetical protein